MVYSPVAVFAYNRYDTVMQVMSALGRNIDAPHTDVFIFSNAAIPSVDGDAEAVDRIRRDLPSFAHCFHRYEIIHRKENHGSNENMLDGIDRVVNEYGRVIVLEDDILTAPAFLTFMNKALEQYEQDEEVFSICGYNPVEKVCRLPGDSFAYDVFRSWGWATWKDRWNSFSMEEDVLSKINIRKVHSICPLYITPCREDMIFPRGTYFRFLDLKLFYKQSAEGQTVIYSRKSLCDNIGNNGAGQTIMKDEDYQNLNFDPEYDVTEFEFSKKKLTIDNDAEYFYEFRWKEFIVDMFFELHFNRERQYMNMYYALSRLQMAGKGIKEFFDKEKLQTVAIYGWGIAGKLLYDLLKETTVKVAYIIDRRDLSAETDIPFYQDIAKDKEVDAVIVTALRDFFEIEKRLYSKTSALIVSMDDVICDCLND